MPRHISEFLLYRWRYLIGYSLIAVAVGSLLVAAAFFAPGSLRQEEITSTVNSSNLSFSSFEPAIIVDLPYRLLQFVSFELFGITTLSVKLPSLVLGMLSLVGAVLLLKQWFRMNIAVISALIVITSSQFIFASQDGTPTIMYIFMPVWLLFLAMKVSRKEASKRRLIWELLLVVSIALSLYTPLSIYIILALLSATMLHPHLRFIISRLPRNIIAGSATVGLIFSAPLILAIFKEPKVGLTLLGIPETLPDLTLNIMELATIHFGFFFSSENAHQPVYTIPSLLLTVLGFVNLFRTRYTARSYIITIWFILLAPVILLNPGKTAITFVPVMLLITSGLHGLLSYWYGMFPRNPYARIAGLLPISLLVVGIAMTGIERYFYVYRYNPVAVADYTSDLDLVSSEAKKSDISPLPLLPSKAEKDFYQAVADKNNTISIIDFEAISANESFMATKSAVNEYDLSGKEPARIITSSRSVGSDRLYLYKSSR